MTDDELLPLDPVELRVLGSLLEKELTVPSTYPMTTNGLRTACNQASGRDPVMALTDDDVLAATEPLKAARLVRLVHASHGARMVKHRQVLTERVDLDDAARAVMTLLLLRGPQTAGELRSRSGRLHDFADLGEVEGALVGLATRDRPLVAEVGRRPGQKERRWSHLLGDPADRGDHVDEAGGAPGNGPADDASPTEALLGEGAQARDRRVAATYEEIASAYAEQLVDELDRKPFDRWLLERLAEFADGGPVADAGCGPGHVAFHLAAAGAEVTGFDRSPAMVAEAQRRFPDVAFEVGDLTDLRLPSGVGPTPGPDGTGGGVSDQAAGADPGWSLIVAWYSLVHFADSELASVIASLVARLSRGGVLAVAVHAGPGLRHADAMYGREVDIDFALHDQAAVVDAFEAAGLGGIEWYRRAPMLDFEVDTERLYVLGHLGVENVDR